MNSTQVRSFVFLGQSLKWGWGTWGCKHWQE